MMRPEKVYVLSHEFVMEWPKYAEKFFLREFSDTGRRYEFSRDVEGFDIRNFGSPEEFLLKAEVLGYAPCFKDFSQDAGWRTELDYGTVDGLVREV